VFGDSICANFKNPNSRAQEYFIIITSLLLKEAEACNEDLVSCANSNEPQAIWWI